jgi:hypothetical protein|tara:strand:+ start:144 stop:248 length:105 start_codon:yes stop_codon:yes gene_type:complete
MNRKIKARRNKEALALRTNLRKRKMFQKKNKKNK